MHRIGIKKFHIQKRTLQQWLTLYIFIMPFFINALTSFFKMPSFLKYTIDAAWMGILIFGLTRPKLRIKRKLLPMVCTLVLFFLCTFVTYGFRFQSVAYYLWGFRNNFRFYIAFFAFVTFLDENDVEGCFHFMDRLFWINVAVSLVQFFMLGYKQDNLGGIFGVDRGCNSFTLVFFSVVLSRSALLMMMGKKKAASCVLQLIAASIIAAMAELKVFFLILVLILVMAMGMTNFSWKKCILAIIAVLSLSLGSSMLVNIFGSSNEMTLENILNLIFAENYSTKSDLGRLNTISVLSSTILHETVDRWLGLGLGNCDTSAFAICNTPFFQTYSYLNYTWFSSAFLFLETGYIGLILFISFFVVCLGVSMVEMKKYNGNSLNCKIAIIMSVLCAIFTIYNSSLRTEVGYIAYFVLAIPFTNRTEEESRNLIWGKV